MSWDLGFHCTRTATELAGDNDAGIMAPFCGTPDLYMLERESNYERAPDGGSRQIEGRESI